jgi:hypothetical protein
MPACPACAEQIPSDVDTCPHCGVSVRGYSPKGGSTGGGGSTKWLIALVVALIGGVLLLCCGVTVLPALLLPAVQSAREAARRTQCQNNLKQIGLALFNYESTYRSFPPAYVADSDGKPMHSWRVLILPFLDQQELYEAYDFSEPWDGPNNSRLLARMPAVYACPSHSIPPETTNTAYAAVFGEHCVFRGAEPVKIDQITDGSSNTLLVVEAALAGIPWMKPDDVDVTKHPALGDQDGFSSKHAGGVHGLLADGAVRFLPQDIAAQTLKALFTRDGGEPVGGF